MKKLYFSKNVVIVVVVDALLFCCAFYLAYLLRFDFRIPRFYRVPLQQVLPFVVLLKLLGFYWFDLYRGMWRYTSLSDLFNIVKAVLITNLVIVTGLLFINRFQGFPRSVFLIDALLTILFVAGFRILIRIYFEHVAGDKIGRVVKKAISQAFSKPDSRARRVIILGAGDCGEKIYREIAHNPSLGFRVAGFLDDNPVKVGKKIHGLPVLGTIGDVGKFVMRLSIDELIIATPTATPEQVRVMVSFCEKSGVPFKTVPSFSELLNGTPSVAALRKVAYRDLLGREVVRLDKAGIGAYLAGKTVLVTGAGGSIGSELCRQILEFSPGRIVLFDRSETALYEIDLELRGQRRGYDARILPVLGDIQDRRQLELLFQQTSPHVVFHAAAYKHVPMLEAYPWKAVKNNILGTQNLMTLSKSFAVERFVLVSTDKAVRPANVMGASKRVAELLLQCGNGGIPCSTQFMIVRFGNVLGSAGSVIPLFQKQIEKGGPITVTHPEVTRFFMTVSEACQLILQAGAIGNTGRGRAEVFVLKMGTPVKIVDMARDLIRLSGLDPDHDIAIEFIGLRPGEKLYEELIVEGEGVVPTKHHKIMVLRGAEATADTLNGAVEVLKRLADIQDGAAIKDCLKKIVPEYTPFFENSTGAGSGRDTEDDESRPGFLYTERKEDQ